MHLSVLFDVLPLLCSQVIAEVVMCLYGTFIVYFSIFLLVSITLVLEISKLLIKCFHGYLTPLKWLAISQQEDLFNQIWLCFNLGGEIYTATPSTNLTASLGGEPSCHMSPRNEYQINTFCTETPSKGCPELRTQWLIQTLDKSESH